MREVQLSRSRDDRRRYEIDGVGWLRRTGLLRTRAEAGSLGDQRWTFEHRGWTGGRAEALDGLSGLPIAEYRRTAKLTQSGTITWQSRTYELHRPRGLRERFALSLGEQQLAEITVRASGKRPVKLLLESPSESEPGLILFACWLCQGFRAQSGAAA